MEMRKAITIYVDEGCYIEAVCAAWIVKREDSEETGVTMQDFWLKGNNAIYVPIKCPADTPVKAWKEDIALPPAEPERKKGKWIKEYWNGEHTRKCSACNITQTVTTYRGKVNFNFCPNCGADMRGENNG